MRPERNISINFPWKKDKVLECILYLTTKGIDLTTYRVVKLLYLTDREHLREFGRPTSFDRYVAMENGPVASHAYNIMKGRVREIGMPIVELPFLLNKRGDRSYAEAPKRAVNKKMFSRSDFHVLDETCKKYGEWSFGQLYDETHKHSAYKKIWSNKNTRADAMKFEDFFEGMENQEQIIENLKSAGPSFR